MHPPANKILSVDGHRAADSFANANDVAGITLMEHAGRAVMQAIIKRWAPRPVLVLCGPGNNGGDGFVVARHLAANGWSVDVALLADASVYTGDAAAMLAKWTGRTLPMESADPSRYALIIDAIFGAGLSRPLSGSVLQLAHKLNGLDAPLVAIDVPTGVFGDTGDDGGGGFKADLTVTFHRLKPAHVLEPGRSLCGQVVLADIGIPEGWADDISADAELNAPSLWTRLPHSDPGHLHKHDKGRLCVVSGASTSTGAARLAASAGLRAGAGLVTLLSPPSALQVNAAHLTTVMLDRFEDAESLIDALEARRATATVIGPGCGVGESTRKLVIAAAAREGSLVLDADALTSFEDDPGNLFSHLRSHDVLTPHEGEFRRLFPDLCPDGRSKIERTRMAAKRAGCVVLYKGPDSVIAAPDGLVRVNTHAGVHLATAGTGDVLAGMIGGLLARGFSSFDAASIGAWVHGEAGIRLGAGLIASDLPDVLPDIFADLSRRRRIVAMRAALNARHKNA